MHQISSLKERKKGYKHFSKDAIELCIPLSAHASDSGLLAAAEETYA
jgi:hypothetical protein